MSIAGLAWRWDWRDQEEPIKSLGEADVLVSHTPDVFPLTSEKTPLVLAGHTQGGQVCLPGARPLATNSVHGYTWGGLQASGQAYDT